MMAARDASAAVVAARLLCLLLVLLPPLLRPAAAYGQGAGSCHGPANSRGHHPDEPYDDTDGGFKLELHPDTAAAGGLQPGGTARLVLRSEGFSFQGFLVRATSGAFAPAGDAAEEDYQLAASYSKFSCAELEDGEPGFTDASFVTHRSSRGKHSVTISFQVPEDAAGLAALEFEYIVMPRSNKWYGPIHLHRNEDGALVAHDAEHHEDDDGEGGHEDDDGEGVELGCTPSSMEGYSCMAQVERAALQVHWRPNAVGTPQASVDFAVVADTQGYVALGFKPAADSRMAPADAVIGWLDAASGEGHVGGYKITGYSLASVKLDDAMHASLSNQSVEEVGGSTVLRFSRTLAAPDGLVAIPEEGLAYLSYALGRRDALEEHPGGARYRGVLSVSLLDGGAAVHVASAARRTYLLHGGMMLLAWVVAAPFTAHVSRHKWLASACSAADAWLRAHRWSALGIALITAVAVILAVVEAGGVSPSHQLHMAVGFVICGLLVAQLLLGFLRASKDSRYRRLWFAAHSWVGRSLLLLAAINCVIGSLALGDMLDGSLLPWVAATCTLLALQLVIAVVLEVLRPHMAARDPGGFVEMHNLGDGAIEEQTLEVEAEEG